MYAMVVMVDEKSVVEPKVCCDCPYIGVDREGYLTCGITLERIPEEIDTEKPENHLCPVACVEETESLSDFCEKHSFSI